MVVLLAGERVLKVDSHTHILPSEIPERFPQPLKLIQYEKATEKGFKARLEFKETGKLFRELKPNCFDAEEVLRQCDSCGVDVQVACTVPVMFNYNMPFEHASEWTEFLNDDLIATVAKHPDRLIGLGTLPLQDTEASVREIQRCVEKGIRGFQIGSHINAYRGLQEDGVTAKIENLPLNHPDLSPVFAELTRMGACIMVHPWDMEWWCNGEYWQPWLVGMPAETTLAGTALILGGVLSQFPSLRVMMSHGGGALPYLKGRIDWGYRCRPDLVAPHCPEKPSEQIKRLYFDSITHDEAALHFMVKLVGPHRVMLGSDYPFPLGEVPSIAPVTEETLLAYPGQLIQDAAMLTFTEKKALLGLSALEWLGVDPEPYLSRVKDQRIKAQLVVPPAKLKDRAAEKEKAAKARKKGLGGVGVDGSVAEAKAAEGGGEGGGGGVEVLAAVNELSEMPASSSSNSLPRTDSQRSLRSMEMDLCTPAREGGGGGEDKESRGRESESSLEDSSHGYIDRRSSGGGKGLEYFPIARKNRTRSFRENPLAELGHQKDQEFPISAEIRVLFPRGEVVAAAGHSLSRPCLRASKLVEDVFDKVNADLHQVHYPSGVDWEMQSFDSDYAYKLHLHKPSREILAELLGCDAEDVMLGNGLSEDLIRLISTHIHPQVLGKKRKIMCLARDFNSDLTIVRTFLLKCVVNALLAVKPLFDEGDGHEMARLLHMSPHGREYQRLSAIFLDPTVSEQDQFREIEASFIEQIEPVEGQGGLYSEDDIVATIEKCHCELAGALFPSICFHTSQLLDMHKVNSAFMSKNVLCVWDMAHSVGNVQHSLANDRIICGAGCGYKHLNGLPGGPGFVYQNASLIRELSATRGATFVRPTPVCGWLAHGRTHPFDAFPVIDRFSSDTLQPAESVQRHRASNPEVLALKVLIANLQVITQYGVSSIMELKSALSECLFTSLGHFFQDEIASGVFKYVTPRDPTKRGATICFSIAGVDAKQVEKALYSDKYKLGYKFEIDLRPASNDSGSESDTFRVTAHYCHMSFSDTVNLAFAIHHAYKRITSRAVPTVDLDHDLSH